MRYLLYWFVSITLFAASAFTYAAVSPLSAEQAFSVSVTSKSSRELITTFQIAPGYYLYKKSIRIQVEPNKIVAIHYPSGELRHDSVRKYHTVYVDRVEIPVKLAQDSNTLQVQVNYQGCSQAGFCYPPMQNTFQINSAVAVTALTQNQNQVRALFDTSYLSMTLLIFAGLGLLLSFTPCVLPMVPILTSIIVGQKHKTNTMKAFLLSLSYVLGAALMYALAGVAAARMGSSLQVWLQQPWIIITVGGMFVLLALSLFSLYELRLPRRVQNQLTGLSNKHQGGTYFSVFLMGMISTLVVSPCVTAPLVGVLMYIGQTGNVAFGAAALFAMGIGMGIPLILIGMSAGKWLPKRGRWMEAIKRMFGLLMLGMAIWLVARVVSFTTVVFLSGLLMVGIAIFIGFDLPRLIGHFKLDRALGYGVGMLGVLVMIGSISNPSLLNALVNYRVVAKDAFVVVHDVTELKQQLLQAKALHKPVMLDFYADWCETCVVMDKRVFGAVKVVNALDKYVRLRVDLSANNEADTVILKAFDVVAPPTVIFFDAEGLERSNERVVGEVNVDEFLARLKSISS